MMPFLDIYVPLDIAGVVAAHCDRERIKTFLARRNESRAVLFRRHKI
jgi:hypothetical protein